MFKFTLEGEILSHKNLYKRARFGGIYMSQRKEFESLLWQLKSQKSSYDNLPITEICELEVSITGNDRKDLNNQVQTLCDLLEKSGIVENDRQIKHIKASKVISKEPKTEIILKVILTK